MKSHFGCGGSQMAGGVMIISIPNPTIIRAIGVSMESLTGKSF
jgi:hypothetical protein